MAPTPKKKVVKKPPTKQVASGKPRGSTSYSGPRQPSLTTNVRDAVVDAIPEAGGSSQRKYRYAKVLKEVREEVGANKPVRIAEFIGANGAATVKRELEAGKKPVDGEVAEWEFAARRLESGGSVLFATLVSN